MIMQLIYTVNHLFIKTFWKTSWFSISFLEAKKFPIFWKAPNCPNTHYDISQCLLIRYSVQGLQVPFFPTWICPEAETYYIIFIEKGWNSKKWSNCWQIMVLDFSFLHLPDQSCMWPSVRLSLYCWEHKDVLQSLDPLMASSDQR